MKFINFLMNTIIRHLQTITMLKVVSRAKVKHNDVALIRDIAGNHYVISVTEADKPKAKVPDTIDKLLKMNE